MESGGVVKEPPLLFLYTTKGFNHLMTKAKRHPEAVRGAADTSSWPGALLMDVKWSPRRQRGPFIWGGS